MKRKLKIYLELCKVRISFFATISTGVGYILATGKMFSGIFAPVIGIFILACGSCALNQIQDREIDVKMNRTKNRPLPSGRINLIEAWIFTVILLITGLSILYFGANLLTMGLGLLAVLWYNGIYMYFKRVTSLAVIPGAFVGAIPPMLGWAASGRSIWEPTIISLATLFFVWQIPHFWLLLMNYSEDYDRGGLPSLTRVFSNRQLERITFVWVVATAVTGILIPIYSSILSPTTNIIFIIVSFWLIWASLNLVKSNGKIPIFMRVFRDINIYILVVVVILTFGKLMGFDEPNLTLLVER